MPKAVAQFTIRDDNDITVGVSAPPSPVIDQLWLDTSTTPSQMKRYNGSTWDIVNDVQVGGRNLAKFGTIIPYGGTTSVDNSMFVKSGKSTFTRSAVYNEGPIIDRYVVYEAGKDYTISFKLKTISGNVSYIHVYNGCSHTSGQVYIDGVLAGGLATNLNFPIDNNYHDVVIRFKGGSVDRGDASTINTTHTILQPMKQNNTIAYEMCIDNFKIEKGNIATGWTPAPEDVDDKLNRTVKAVDVMYYLSTSSTTLQGGTWQTVAPQWVDGKYMWSKTTTVFTDGTSSDSQPTCIAGATGPTGSGYLTFTTNYSYAQTNIDTYGKAGYVGVWSVNESTSSCKVGDTVSLKVRNTTKSCDSFIVAKVNTVYTSSLNTTTIGLTEGGVTGQGVSSITEEYYLSTSKTTQTGGSWVTTPPTWSSGKYMWTRSKIVYSNPTSTVYTNPICDSSWEAVNEVVIGGRNLIMDTSSDLITTPSISSFVYIMTATDIGALGLVPGDTITFRIYLKPQAGTTDKIMARISQYYGDGTAYQNDLGNEFIGGQEGYSTVTTTIRSDIHSKGIFLSINNASRVNNPTVLYKEAKLERGNKPTDWSPAPEDTYQSIHDLDERVYTAEQKVEKNAIISTVTESSVWKTIQTKLINNFSISGTMDQWSTNSSCTIVADSEVGNYMSVTTTSNVMVTSDYFEIDPSASYKLSLMIKNPSASGTGSWYFGIYAYDKDKSSIGVYVGSGTSLQTNPYFAWESKANQNLKWRTFDGYLYSHNTTIDTYTPKGNSTYCFRMDPKTKYVRVRFLHYRAPSSYGDGSSGSMYYAHPTITSIDNIIVDTETRLKTAEVSILPGSIISTVTNSTNWSSLNNTANTALANANSALQKITPSEILNSVNTQIGKGGQINTVSTILDKTGFTVKNGAIKVQNKNGENVMTSDTNGNLILNGGNMKIQNIRGGLTDIAQFFGGTIGPGLTLTSYATNTGNQQSSVSIRLSPNDVDRMEINAENLSIIGNKGGSLSASTVNATSTSTSQLWINNNQVFNGSDTWVRTYGNTGWYNGTYGGGWYMQDNTWIRSHSSKAVYVDNLVRADKGFQVGDGGTYFSVSSVGTVGCGNLTSRGGLTAVAESKFSVGTYTDPLYGVSCAIKATGRIAANYMHAEQYRFASTNCSINSRSTGGFDFWIKDAGDRIVFDGTVIYRVTASGAWIKLAG